MLELHTEAIQAFIEKHIQESDPNVALPISFYPVLYSAIDYLRMNKHAEKAIHYLEYEAFFGIKRFHNLKIDHARLKILALNEANRKNESQPLLEYFASRPFLFEDIGKLGFFLFHDALRCLQEHDSKALENRLSLLAQTHAGIQDAYMIRLIHQAGGMSQLFAIAKETGYLTRVMTAVICGAQRLAGKGIAAGVIGRGLHFCLNVFRTVTRLKGSNQRWILPTNSSSTPSVSDRKLSDNRPILVTRAMGGIGDILMMTPGLHALRLKHPNREIHFAIPKNFHLLLQHNSDVVLKDIHQETFFQEDYHALYNLTECPASRVESATLPNVKRNRIDIFSAAMGIRPKELDVAGRVPIYIVTQDEKDWAKAFFAEQGLVPENCIAVQPYAADSYKDYPHMERLVERIAQKQPVLVFHGIPLQGFNHQNIKKIDNYSLRQSIAILSLCKMLIAVDSSFVHIAASMAKRTVALFGPTDGTLFTKHYPECHVIDGYKQVHCKACWRNQAIVCAKSGSIKSQCLKHLPENQILELLI